MPKASAKQIRLIDRGRAGDITFPDYVRYMNVIDVDDDAKTITTKFGGAESGSYKIWIRHSSTGLIEADGLTLDVNAYMTSYSPATLTGV